MSDLTEDSIMSDCFYPILERMNSTFLDKHYGPNFMSRPTWIADFIRRLKSEMTSSYPRESFMMSFYMASEHLYGLPERANKF